MRLNTLKLDGVSRADKCAIWKVKEADERESLVADSYVRRPAGGEQPRSYVRYPKL